MIGVAAALAICVVVPFATFLTMAYIVSWVTR